MNCCVAPNRPVTPVSTRSTLPLLACRPVLTVAPHGLQPKRKDDAVKRFRFLDLPREIRLIVYEQLTIKHTETIIPLNNIDKLHGTLINLTLPGIRILQTCRLVYVEAMHILSPPLSHMLATPPTLMIEGANLLGVCYRGGPYQFYRTIMHRIILAASRAFNLAMFHRYRNGMASVKEVRYILGVGARFSNDQVDAIITFVLRLDRSIAHRVALQNDDPSFRVVIQKPPQFDSLLITYQSPQRVSIFFRKHILRRPTTPRLFQVVATFGSLTRQFVYVTGLLCNTPKTPRVSVSLNLEVLPADDGHVDEAQTELEFKSNLSRGRAMVPRRDGQVLISYGGMYVPEVM